MFNITRDRCLLALVCLLVLAVGSQGFSGTALDAYVHTVDDVYGYDILSQERGADYTLHKLKMTSQRWQTAAFSDHSIWHHSMWVCVPDHVQFTSHGTLFINAGDDTDDYLNGDDLETVFLNMCSQTKAISTMIFQIPNQPIAFPDDPTNGLYEDAIIAHTFRSFLNQSGNNPTQLLHFAMTKACVRGLDTIQNFAANHLTPSYNIQTFMVTGASKRGWATWLTSAVDERVTVNAPISIALLNMGVNLLDEYPSLGEWGWALDDYTAQRIFDYAGTPQFDLLLSHVDPLSYNSRYGRLPKLLIDGTLDQFFLLDATKYFWNQLAGPKYLCLIPNGDHTLIGVADQLTEELISWFLLTATHTALPVVTWNKRNSNTTNVIPYIEVTSTMKNRIVESTEWSVTTTRAGVRDFRLNQCPPVDDTYDCYQYLVNGNEYEPTTLSPTHVNGDSVTYKANITDLVLTPKVSDQHWTGFLAQLHYQIPINTIGGVASLHLTSEALVWPDFYPFPHHVPDYAAVGLCNLTATFDQTLVNSWTDGTGKKFSQWNVVIHNTHDLYSPTLIKVVGTVTNLWGLTQVSGNVYKIPAYQYQNGRIPANANNIQFSYIIQSPNPAQVSMDNTACSPSTSGCSVKITPVVTSTWNAGGKVYQSVSLNIKNTGTNLAANTQVVFNFASGAQLTQRWNLDQVSATTYSCSLFNLPAGATSTSCGYVISSQTAPGATVSAGQTICVSN